MRGPTPPGGSPSQKRLSSVEDLYRLSLNPTQAVHRAKSHLQRRRPRLTLIEGAVFVSDTDQGTTALVFLGRGEMAFRPAPDREKSQVRIFSGAEAIETPVRCGCMCGSIPATSIAGCRAGSSCRRRRPRRPEEGRADLPRGRRRSRSASSSATCREKRGRSLPNRRDFVAEIHTRRFDTLTYSRSSSSARGHLACSIASRQKTIALYSSERNGWTATLAARRGRRSPRSTCDHYDIDIVGDPDRQWIEGRRAGCRVRRREHGRQQPRDCGWPSRWSCTRRQRRVRPAVQHAGQRSGHGSWSVFRRALVQGTELTLTMTYAGRLEPAATDTRIDRRRGSLAARPSWTATSRLRPAGTELSVQQPDLLVSASRRPATTRRPRSASRCPAGLGVRRERRTRRVRRRSILPAGDSIAAAQDLRVPRRSAAPVSGIRREPPSSRSRRRPSVDFPPGSTDAADAAERHRSTQLERVGRGESRARAPRPRGGGARRRHRALLPIAPRRFAVSQLHRGARRRDSARRAQPRLLRAALRAAAARRGPSRDATIRRRSNSSRISSWRTNSHISGGARRSAGATITSSG